MNIREKVSQLVSVQSKLGNEIIQSDNHDWVKVIEARFGTRLPEAYRHLMAEYKFASIEVGQVVLFGNTYPTGELLPSHEAFLDLHLTEWLVPKRYFQIGRPRCGSYDPVCIDCTSNRADPAVIIVDHEDILCCRGKVRMRQSSESFLALLSSVQD